MKFLIWLLDKLHNFIHYCKFPHKSCFPLLGIKIKLENRQSKCWNCRRFDGFYYDEMTYECLKYGTMMWGEEGICEVKK